MYTVKDGDRTLQFNGILLSKSTSERKGSNRWIEFELYKTESGSYILSRIGVSLVFHGAACSIVSKYKLSESSIYDISRKSMPCDECNPDDSLDLVFPEKYRYWAMVTSDPRGILDSLYRESDNGTYYLTSVSQRLLRDAAKLDKDIADVYNFEIVP